MRAHRLKVAGGAEGERRGKLGAGGLRGFEPARQLRLALRQRQRAQVAAVERQRIVEDDVARIGGDQLRVWRFAVEPLLEVGEARDPVASLHDQLAIEDALEVHARKYLGKGA